MKNEIKFYASLLMVIFAVICIGWFAIFMWNVQRRVNYRLSYRSMVQEQVNTSIAEHIKKYHGDAK